MTKCQSPTSSASSNALTGFKAALRSGDIKSAMVFFAELHGLSTKGSESPSSAPQMFMEQLVKLAVQSGAQKDVLQLLTKMGLSANALDLLLAESVGNGEEICK